MGGFPVFRGRGQKQRAASTLTPEPTVPLLRGRGPGRGVALMPASGPTPVPVASWYPRYLMRSAAATPAQLSDCRSINGKGGGNKAKRERIIITYSQPPLPTLVKRLHVQSWTGFVYYQKFTGLSDENQDQY